MVPTQMPSPSGSVSLGTSGETFSSQVDPIQLPQVHQQFKNDPFITSVSGVIGNGSPLFAFKVPSIQVAWISTSTAFANGPTGRIFGSSASRTMSSPSKYKTLSDPVSHPLLLKFSSGFALNFHVCMLPGTAVISFVKEYKLGSNKS